MQTYLPGVWDRLLDEAGSAAGRQTLAQLKASVARDLEALLNTRVALPAEWLTGWPACEASVLNYGLGDFAGLCLTSSADRKAICDSLQTAIARHEPRLTQVRAQLARGSGLINRLEFVISATLTLQAGERVAFNAVLQPSSLRYAIAPAAHAAPN